MKAFKSTFEESPAPKTPEMPIFLFGLHSNKKRTMKNNCRIVRRYRADLHEVRMDHNAPSYRLLTTIFGELFFGRAVIHVVDPDRDDGCRSHAYQQPRDDEQRQVVGQRLIIVTTRRRQ